MAFEAKKYTPLPAPFKAAFIGLGVMGYPMAGHLKLSGCDVTVFNRTSAKAQKWVQEFGGRYALTPKDASKGADVVFTCVGNDDDLRSVLLGPEGCFAGMKKGAVLWDATTDSADVAREMYQEAAKLGLHFVDAPVSGGQSGAEKGILTVMCGGDADVIARCAPAAEAFAVSIKRIGESGCGQLAKMCNQICIGGLVQALSEAVAFGLTNKLDMPLVLDVIGKGAAGSWQMHNRGKTMIEDRFDFGFAIDWMIKDLGICIEQAKKSGAELPVTKIVEGYYQELSKAGDGRLDTSALIRRLNRKPRA